jgi:hypothetical protein
MEDLHVAAPKRQFVGRPRPPGRRGDPSTMLGVTLSGSKGDDLAALADALITDAAPPTAPSPAPAPRETAPAPPPAPIRGLYVLVLAGIAAADRRRTALAVAERLAPPGRTAALFTFEGSLTDAHVLGEPGCGRLGPQNYLATVDTGRAVGDLLAQCDQVAVIPLDAPHGALRRLGRAAGRAIFVAAGGDAESLVETYRHLKSWRAMGIGSDPALFVVGSNGPHEAGRLHRRLREASRHFLGCDLADLGFLSREEAATAAGRAPPIHVLAQTPAAEVWPSLLAAAERQTAGLPAPPEQPVSDAAGRAPASVEAMALAPSGVFSLWTPEDRAALLSAIEVQAPALLGESPHLVFHVDVDEADAPPLAAIRADGSLVAILLADGRGPCDPQSAARWLAAHRSLLARAYPYSGLRADAAPTAVVLAPLETPPGADGVRRFLTVRMGGHRGIVLMP